MQGQGYVEVIAGPMFSGKSEALIGRLFRARLAKQKVQVFKPSIDNRYAHGQIVSHSELSLEAQVVSDSQELAKQLLSETQVVGVDEAQFFDEGIVDLLQRLADQGKRVVVAGLDLDYTGKPFEVMSHLLALSEYVSKTLAVCVQCGAPASRSQRLVAADSRVVIGASDAYEARCRHCHTPRIEAATIELFPQGEATMPDATS